MRCIVSVPKRIRFYNTTDDFNEYQHINDKFWLNIYDFISKYGTKEDIGYRHHISKIYVDHIAERLHYLTKINGEFIPTCHEEKHVDIWMRNNHSLLGFGEMIFYTSSYPDCECKFDIKLSKILFELYNKDKNVISNFLFRHINGYRMTIELEYLSSNFKYHKHDPDCVDMIICYKKNREILDSRDIPVPILELKSFGVIPDRTDEDCSLENIEMFVDDVRQRIMDILLTSNIDKDDLIEHRDNLIRYLELVLETGTEKDKSFIINNPEIQDTFSILKDCELVASNSIRNLIKTT